MTQSYSEMLDAHRARRRETLLLAAAAVLNERGLRQTTMDQVAQGAGVSKVVLYRYFESKDRLVHEVLSDVVDALLRADDVDVDWWTKRLHRTLAVARSHAAAMCLLVRHASHDPEFGIHFDRLTQALVGRVEERQAAILGPESSDTPGDVRILAESVTAFLLDAYVRWMENGDPARDEQFLAWITSSVRATVYYWRGLAP